MTKFNELNKKELEKEFANDFASPVFPILSEMYLKDHDFFNASELVPLQTHLVWL